MGSLQRFLAVTAVMYSSGVFAALPHVARFDVFEASVAAPTPVAMPFQNAVLRAVFTGPGNRDIVVDGFFDGGKIWRVRFSPDGVGEWSWSAVLNAPEKIAGGSGKFICDASPNHGFLRMTPANPFRFVRDDGTSFYPIGQQFGWGVPDTPGFDAPDASGWRSAPRAEVLAAFRGATNLIRSQLGIGSAAGVALDVFKGTGDPWTLNLDQCRRFDEACRVVRGQGWAHLITPFQDMSEWYEESTVFGKARDLAGYKNLDGPMRPAMEAYLKYVVARWGVWADIWEIYNEDSWSPDNLLRRLAEVVRSADPYRHPVTTNYDRPAESWCEILTPHTYRNDPPQSMPAMLTAGAAARKSYGKPVIHTEFGNGSGRGNDDPVAWRLAAWTAFMNEEALVFWNMSGKRIPVTAKGHKGNSNAYLGAEARAHLKVLAAFTAPLAVSLRPVSIGWTDPENIGALALSNGDTMVVYLTNPDPAEKAVKPGSLNMVPTGAGMFDVTWLNPADGRVTLTRTISSAELYTVIPTPSFTVDAAALIKRR